MFPGSVHFVSLQYLVSVYIITLFVIILFVLVFLPLMYVKKKRYVGEICAPFIFHDTEVMLLGRCIPEINEFEGAARSLLLSVITGVCRYHHEEADGFTGTKRGCCR